MSSRKTKNVSTLPDSRLEFAKAINNLTSKQESFAKALETLSEFTKDELTNYDLQIESKQTEMTLLDELVN